MSADEGEEASCCASCGIAEVDEIKLKECSACDLVRYCSDACQREHNSQHQQECKKRAAELRDEILFKQPESTNIGDCPICMVPLPLDSTKSIMWSCCSKIICNGCAHANGLRERKEKLGHSCPFCRKPVPSTKKQCDKQIMKRIAANDPVAMHQKGMQQYRKGDYRRAFEYYTRAAELGDAAAQYGLGRMYEFGKGVEKDEGKEYTIWKRLQLGGIPVLGVHLDGKNGAKLGDDDSMEMLMIAFKSGLVSKDDLASALRAHQAAEMQPRVRQGTHSNHYNLLPLLLVSIMYYEGQGVEKDKKKDVYHLEQAAIGGHPNARHNLVVCYRKGFVSKEDFAEALRARQVAVNFMKSPQRDKAKVALSKLKAAKAARQN
ncbi:Sel1-like repeat family protein [Skeletonema marinoi]|uniref:Sel1-like repeat family protein n=1 Tax=Skeletonema marinoi TaxID=267567 RepID=A0AAD8YJM4_9STRA|nr:Sel1-like repeat family protein [Skeletonema marinoi]